MIDSIVESIREQYLERSKGGIVKYGVTLDRKDLTQLQWLQHAKEEAMDLTLYLEKAIQEIKNTQLEYPHRES